MTSFLQLVGMIQHPILQILNMVPARLKAENGFTLAGNHYFASGYEFTPGEPVSSSNANQIRAFNLNFGDDEATGIISVHDSGFMVNGSDAWYTIDGRKLDGQPTAKGLYIHGGKKVVIK